MIEGSGNAVRPRREMKETLKLVGVLFLICLVAGVLLAAVNMVTEEPIAAAAHAEKMAAITTVLPDCDNDPNADAVQIEHDGRIWTFYVARMKGSFAGAAFEARSARGYGGEIVVMVGADADNRIQAIEILKQKETPGLGARIENPDFKGRFSNLAIRDTRWKVRKDNGDIDQITAATISSRAVVEAIGRSVQVYLANKDAIAGSGSE